MSFKRSNAKPSPARQPPSPLYLCVAKLRDACLKAPPATQLLCKHFLTIVQNLNKTARSPIHSPISAALQLMRTNSKDLSSVQFCASFLRQVVDLDNCKRALVKLGAVEQILVALRNFTPDPLVATTCCEILYFLAFDIDEEMKKKSTSNPSTKTTPTQPAPPQPAPPSPDLLPHILHFVCGCIKQHKTLATVTTPCSSLLFALSMSEEYLSTIAQHAKDFHFVICISNLSIPEDEDDTADTVGLLAALLENAEWRAAVLTSSDAATQLKSKLEQILAQTDKSNKDIIESSRSCIDALCAYMLSQHDRVRRQSLLAGDEQEETLEDQLLKQRVAILTEENGKLAEQAQISDFLFKEQSGLLSMYLEQALMMQEELDTHRYNALVANNKHHPTHRLQSPAPRAGGPTSSKSPTESTRIATRTVKSYMIAHWDDNEESETPQDADRIGYLSSDAAVALELSFMVLIENSGTVPKSRFRKFLRNIGLCFHLAQADLIMKAAGGTKTLVDFKLFVEVIMQLSAEKFAGDRGGKKKRDVPVSSETVVRRMISLLGRGMAPGVPNQAKKAKEASDAEREMIAEGNHSSILENEHVAMKRIFQYYAVVHEKEHAARTPGKRLARTPFKAVLQAAAATEVSPVVEEEVLVEADKEGEVAVVEVSEEAADVAPSNQREKKISAKDRRERERVEKERTDKEAEEKERLERLRIEEIERAEREERERAPPVTPAAKSAGDQEEPPKTPGSRFKERAVVIFIPFKNLMQFTRDFCVSPDLLSRQKAQQIFKDIVNEEDGEHISDSAILTEEERIGLKYEQFLEFISIVAVQCTWFVKSKKKKGGVAKTNVAGEDEGGELALLALLQWLDSSNGKHKINRTRGQAIIPTFQFVNDARNIEKLTRFFVG